MDEGDSGVQIFSIVLGLAILALIGLFANSTTKLSESLPASILPAAVHTATAVQAPAPAFAAIPDQYTTLAQVTQALRGAGLEASELIIGIDFTKSNEWQGSQTFRGKCLHALEAGSENPYEAVMGVIGHTLADFDDDNLIPVYAFGDSQSRDRKVTPLHGTELCQGVDAALTAYRSAAERLQLSGPTSFAPLIRQACRIAGKVGTFHILIIIADGAVTNEKETAGAIVEACAYPLSIVMVGVGDGPWDTMERFDDGLPQRTWDNFQFVPFAQVTDGVKHPRTTFAVAALQEIPSQYATIRRMGLLGGGAAAGPAAAAGGGNDANQ